MMKSRIWWPIVAVVIIGLVAVFYPRRASEPPPLPVTLPEPPPHEGPAPEAMPPEEADPEPAPDFLVEPPAEPAPPLPPLDESDAAAREVLADLAGPALVAEHLAADSLVRRLVATLDSLTSEAMWIEARAVPRVGGTFLVSGPDDAPRIAAANSARYEAFVRLAGAVDAEAVAAAYRRHYPLLQQAYEQLGYPGRQFHNRVLEVIDHLLATPRVTGPVRLEQPHVLYKFADPELEALSSGQKILLRVGPENADILRGKLIELRAALESLAAPPGTP